MNGRRGSWGRGAFGHVPWAGEGAGVPEGCPGLAGPPADGVGVEQKQAGSQGLGDAGQNRQNGFGEKNNSCFNLEDLTELSSSLQANSGTAPGGPGSVPLSVSAPAARKEPPSPVWRPPLIACCPCCPGLLPLPPRASRWLAVPCVVPVMPTLLPLERDLPSQSFCLCLFNHDHPATGWPWDPARCQASPPPVSPR